MQDDFIHIVIKQEKLEDFFKIIDSMYSYIDKKKNVPYKIADQLTSFLVKNIPQSEEIEYKIRDSELNQIEETAKKFSDYFASDKNFQFTGTSKKSAKIYVPDIEGFFKAGLYDTPAFFTKTYSLYDLAFSVLKKYRIDIQKNDLLRQDKDLAIEYFYLEIGKYGSSNFNDDHLKSFIPFRKKVLCAYLTILSGFEITNRKPLNNQILADSIKNALKKQKPQK